MDASNLLKPMLARGELHTIGATTLDEYRKHIEKDAALERRFQPVVVDQPTVEETISHPARPARALRGAPRRPHHGLGARRGRHPLQPLHHRALPARQGDRPRRRGGQPSPDGDRLHAGGARRAGAAADPAGDRAGSTPQGEGRGVQDAPGDPGGRARRDRRAGGCDETALGNREGKRSPVSVRRSPSWKRSRSGSTRPSAKPTTERRPSSSTEPASSCRSVSAPRKPRWRPRMAGPAFSRRRWTRTTSPRSSAPGQGSR